jgi:hypothetical protein
MIVSHYVHSVNVFRKIFNAPKRGKGGIKSKAAAAHTRATAAFLTGHLGCNGGRACTFRYNSVMSTVSTK